MQAHLYLNDILCPSLHLCRQPFSCVTWFPCRHWLMLWRTTLPQEQYVQNSCYSVVLCVWTLHVHKQRNSSIHSNRCSTSIIRTDCTRPVLTRHWLLNLTAYQYSTESDKKYFIETSKHLKDIFVLRVYVVRP